MRDYAKLRVLPDPVDVGLQSLDELIRASVDPGSVVEKNEIETPQWLRHRIGIYPPADDRRETLV